MGHDPYTASGARSKTAVRWGNAQCVPTPWDKLHTAGAIPKRSRPRRRNRRPRARGPGIELPFELREDGGNCFPFRLLLPQAPDQPRLHILLIAGHFGSTPEITFRDLFVQSESQTLRLSQSVRFNSVFFCLSGEGPLAPLGRMGKKTSDATSWHGNNLRAHTRAKVRRLFCLQCKRRGGTVWPQGQK